MDDSDSALEQFEKLRAAIQEFFNSISEYFIPLLDALNELFDELEEEE